WAKKAYGKSITEQMEESKTIIAQSKAVIKEKDTTIKEKDTTITNAIIGFFTRSQMSVEEIAVTLQIEVTVVKRVLRKEGLLKKKITSKNGIH
ncbi:MAG TPA: hypothetical protein PK230_08250, partial [Chitinophagales bacterium]|nr:hypothetical protein [Chitinophagales bacterium]